MTSDSISSQEKLDRLYAEEKITLEEYERLQRSLEGEPDRFIVNEQNKQIPWQVWFSIGVLIVAALLGFPELAKKNQFGAIMSLIVTPVFVYGLYHKHRWAFITFVFFSFLNVFFCLQNVVVVLMNLAFGSILLTAYPYFFGKTNDSSSKAKGHSMRKWITAAFAGVLILFAVVMGIGFYAAHSLSVEFTEYQKMTRCNAVLGKINTDLLAIHDVATENSFVAFSLEASKAKIDNASESITDNLTQAKKEMSDSKEAYWFEEFERSFVPHLNEYCAETKKYLQVKEFFRESKEYFYVRGTAITESLTGIMAAANTDGDTTAMSLSGSAVQHFVPAHLNLLQLINNEIYHSINSEMIGEELNKAGEALTALDPELKKPESRSLLTTAQEAFKAYRDNFQPILKNSTERDEFVVKTHVLNEKTVCELTDFGKTLEEMQKWSLLKIDTIRKRTFLWILILGGPVMLLHIVLSYSCAYTLPKYNAQNIS